MTSFLRRLKNAVRGQSSGPLLSPPHRILGHAGAVLAPTSRLYARGDRGHVVLGNGVYLGRNVELATALGGDLFVGRDTSIQDNCVLQGDLTIGAHCLFGANVMISTTIHRFRDHPAWLIRDQDAAIAAAAEKPADYSRPVMIEDDCWIGWGAAIMPGVTIGRGAIVGANCVVTSDIGPYEIHGGVPNRLLSKRLDFAPPPAISSSNSADLPYFYRGFRLTQADLTNSRMAGIAVAQGRAALVLAGGAQAVEITGSTPESNLNLEVRINGRTAPVPSLAQGEFRLAIPVEAHGTGPLAAFTAVELIDRDHAGATGLHSGENRFAIASARLI